MLQRLGRHGPWFLFGGVFLGLLLPDLASLFRPLLTPAVICLLLLALLRVNWQAMGDYLRRPVVGALMTVWLMLAAPVLTWLVVRQLPLPDSLKTAIVLMAAAPPILAATTIAILVGLDGAMAMVAGLLATLLSPLTVPPLALALLGLELDIGIASFMARLAAVILAAFVGAAIIRRVLGLSRLQRHGQRIDGMTVLVMLVFAISIMDGVSAALLADPLKVGLWVVAAFVANPLLQLLGALAFCWLGLRRALTAGLLSGNCNMGLLLAALSSDADFEIRLFLAVSQLPMYMLPALVLPFYRRLLAHGRAASAEP
jgi:BASS family bile acid:Na+ symporter